MTDFFDVFFSHNSQDKPVVRELAQALTSRGLQAWLDEEQLVPGRPWQEALETIIASTQAAAVLIGPSGIGPWETAEMRGCLHEFVKRKLPVIPVLLPGAPAEPELPLFLRDVTWVDLRAGWSGQGLDKLEWGVTGVKPERTENRAHLPVIETATRPADGFSDKVREHIKQLLAGNTALRDALLKDQPSGTTPETALLPCNGSITPEQAARLWRKAVKSCLEQHREHRAEIKRCAEAVFGWLIVLSVHETALAAHRNVTLDFDRLDEIVVPVKTPAGTEVFIARLHQRAAEFRLYENRVGGARRIDPGELELGLLSPDRLREIERMIYTQVLYADPPPDGDWLAELKDTLELRYEDDQKMYYVTLNQAGYAADLGMVKQLKTDLPHLRAIIIGADATGGNSMLLMDESRLVVLIREFLILLREYP